MLPDLDLEQHLDLEPDLDPDPEPFLNFSEVGSGINCSESSTLVADF